MHFIASARSFWSARRVFDSLDRTPCNAPDDYLDLRLISRGVEHYHIGRHNPAPSHRMNFRPAVRYRFRSQFGWQRCVEAAIRQRVHLGEFSADQKCLGWPSCLDGVQPEPTGARHGDRVWRLLDMWQGEQYCSHIGDDHRRWVLIEFSVLISSGAGCDKVANCPFHPRSGFVSRPERKDEAEHSSPTCRPAPGYPDNINDSHILGKVKQILREAKQTTNSNNGEHGQNGEIRLQAFHDCSLSANLRSTKRASVSLTC